MTQILEILERPTSGKAYSQSGKPEFGRRLDPELELLARWLDTVFHIPGIGIRFGLDAIVGLIPGVGDTVTSLASLYILAAGRRYGVPRIVMLRMALNIAIDYVVGAVPLLGDLFDVYWKANQKNVALLRHHLEATPTEERRARLGDKLFLAGLIVGLLLILAGAVMTAWWILSSLGHMLMNLGT